MLKKLIKYEFLNIYRLTGVLSLCILGTLLMGRFFLWCLSEFRISAFLFPVILVLFLFLSMGLCFSAFLFLGVRFYQNLYSNEGYLTHTLPVPTWMHLASKMIVHFFAGLLVTILTIIGVLLFIRPLANSGAFLPTQEEYHQSFSLFCEEFGGILPTAFQFVLFLLTGTLSTLSMMYASISLGSLFTRHRVLASVGIFAAIYTCLEIVACILLILFLHDELMLAMTQSGSSYSNGLYKVFPLTSGLNFIVSALLLWICHHILTKKLNLI